MAHFMTRLGWTGSLFMVLGLVLGVVIGWGLCRQVSGMPGSIIQVAKVPPYEPVEIVPDSAGWPKGSVETVQTVVPPTRKEARKLEKDFGFRLSRTSLLGKFDLPDLPDGGKAVVHVPKGGNEEPALPVKLTVRANRPPLVRVRWEPRFEGWYGYSAEGNSWSSYLKLGRLLCIRDRVCVQARAGREGRLWGEGWVAEAGISIRF